MGQLKTLLRTLPLPVLAGMLTAFVMPRVKQAIRKGISDPAMASIAVEGIDVIRELPEIERLQRRGTLTVSRREAEAMKAEILGHKLADYVRAMRVVNEAN
jgi:hypothetical protein